MTIKHHIILSATITVALIAVIACQQKTQAPQTKEQPKAVTEQTAKVEEAVKNLEQEVEAKAGEVEAKITEAIQKVEEEVKEEAKEAEQSVKNLLSNGDFSEKKNNWQSHENVKFLKDENGSFIEIDGTKAKQSRIWQGVETEAGHVYKLTFKAKGEKEGAFAIFRNHDTDEESYFYFYPSKNWREFSKEFKAEKDGKYIVYLSCQGDGKYYYTDAVLVDVTEK
ncbi:hypothetical protein IKZ80_04490 [bacterium]|nr:hypothetical protein [bacterium]MBR6461634.1 hypothetical protein [bacterium]